MLSQLELNIARALKKKRKESGFVQKEVASATNINVSSICKLESGKQAMSVRHLLAMSQSLGVAPEEVITEAKNMVIEEA